MMNKLSILITLVLLTWTNSTYAYIPSAEFISTRAVRNAGQGLYQLRKEIVFSNQSRSITVTEHWWIQNEGLMFLKVESPSFTQFYLYKNGKRYSFNKEQGLVATNASSGFYMPLFFERNPNEFRETLVKKRIAPAQTFRKRPIIKTNKDISSVAQLNEPYIKLSRVKNTVAVLLGFAAQNESKAGIWLEQDRFAIRKIRFEDQSELNVDQIAELSRNLNIPKTYSLNWNEQTVQVELSQGNSISKPSTFFNENEFSKLANQVRSIPEDNSHVIEFYRKFR